MPYFPTLYAFYTANKILQNFIIFLVVNILLVLDFGNGLGSGPVKACC
jgi:hypothetical protein